MHTPMNADSRYTIYGGAGIGGACLALGFATEPVIAVTGLGIMFASLFVAMLFDQYDVA